MQSESIDGEHGKRKLIYLWCFSPCHHSFCLHLWLPTIERRFKEFIHLNNNKNNNLIHKNRYLWLKRTVFSSYCYDLKSMFQHLSMFVDISTSGAGLKCLVSAWPLVDTQFSHCCTTIPLIKASDAQGRKKIERNIYKTCINFVKMNKSSIVMCFDCISQATHVPNCFAESAQVRAPRALCTGPRLWTFICVEADKTIIHNVWCQSQ